jgi:hypothetical protein
MGFNFNTDTIVDGLIMMLVIGFVVSVVMPNEDDLGNL